MTFVFLKCFLQCEHRQWLRLEMANWKPVDIADL